MKEMVKIFVALLLLLIMVICLLFSSGDISNKYETALKKFEYVKILNEAYTLELVFKIYNKERGKSAFDTDLLTTINDLENKDGLNDLNYINFRYSDSAVNSLKLINDKEKVYFVNYSYSTSMSKKIDIENCTYIENTKDSRYPKKIETVDFNNIKGSEISIALGDDKYACFEHPESSKLEEDENRYVFIYRIE